MRNYTQIRCQLYYSCQTDYHLACRLGKITHMKRYRKSLLYMTMHVYGNTHAKERFQRPPYNGQRQKILSINWSAKRSSKRLLFIKNCYVMSVHARMVQVSNHMHYIVQYICMHIPGLLLTSYVCIVHHEQIHTGNGYSLFLHWLSS